MLPTSETVSATSMSRGWASRPVSTMLTGAGRLWMVANRHLPYEQVLRECFADMSEIGGDSRFKILTATGAHRPGARRLQQRGKRR